MIFMWNEEEKVLWKLCYSSIKGESFTLPENANEDNLIELAKRHKVLPLLANSHNNSKKIKEILGQWKSSMKNMISEKATV